MEISANALPPGIVRGITGVILAIDYGQKKLGLALSDPDGISSRPLATWIRTNRRRDLARLRELVRKHSIRLIVVGLPLHLDGSASSMSAEAMAFSVRVHKAIGIPVEMMDERLTSWEAKQTRAVMGRNSRSSPIDDEAAAIILRDYLERFKTPPGLRG